MEFALNGIGKVWVCSRKKRNRGGERREGINVSTAMHNVHKLVHNVQRLQRHIPFISIWVFLHRIEAVASSCGSA
jgi:hypothetical protein